MEPTRNRNSSKAGLPPGTLVYLGRKKEGSAQLSSIEYDADHVEFEENVQVDSIDFSKLTRNCWLNIDGLHDVETIAAVGKKIALDELLLEDILNTGHRPKFEEFGDHIFLTLKMIGIAKNRKSLVYEQVSVVAGKNWVVSFQERRGDVFDGLRERLQTSGANIRKANNDYLFYRIIDTVVDNYFLVSEYLGDELLKLEEKVLEAPESSTPLELQSIRKKIAQFKKSVIPLREAVTAFQRSESKIIKPKTQRYLVDVSEHIIQILDTTDSQRELHAGIMDLYYSAISNKTNQIMQVLTIIATIFIPLTFVAGIYGMNFKVMPELEWEYGYLVVWIVMIALATGMVMVFRKRKWF